MRNQVLKRKTDFQQRLKQGQSFENQVETYLKRQGFMVSKLNIESLSRDHVQRIITLNDKTSIFTKLLPDRICTMPGQYSFFAECKRSTIESKYYSFAKNEFDFQRSLCEQFNIKILVIYSDWTGMLKAQWIDKIDNYLPNNGSTANGSQKPFILIPKSSIPLLLNTTFNRLSSS